MIRLIFCQNDYLLLGSFWQKNSLITHIQPILLFFIHPLHCLISIATLHRHVLRWGPGLPCQPLPTGLLHTQVISWISEIMLCLQVAYILLVIDYHENWDKRPRLLLTCFPKFKIDYFLNFSISFSKVFDIFIREDFLKVISSCC